MSSFLDFMMDDSTASSQNDKLKESMKNRGTGTSNVWYNYRRNMDYGASTKVRFLPASSEIAENEVQPKFWVPKKVIRLRFENPQKEGSEVILPIPAMQMYTGCKTENDLVLKQAKALFDESEALKKKGREEEAKQIHAKGSYHWHRGETIAQAFVVKSGFLESDPPENPIRLLELNKQLMNVINATLNSDDPDVKLEYWPCHGRKGSDFIIKKTKSGDWPKYDAGSCFARSPTPWTTEQIESLERFGLFKLEDFLPAQPSDEEYQILAEIVRLSIEGERVWNPDWEDHLKTVKVYRTNMDNSGGDSEVDVETIQSQVRETMSRLAGTGSSSSSDVLSSLSRSTVSDAVYEDVAEETSDDEPEVVQTVSPPTKSADQVRSVVERIKGRTSGKTASASAD
jgi:hypothetical protein